MNKDDQINYNKPFDINEWKNLCRDAYAKVVHSRVVFQFIDALAQIERMKSTILFIAQVGCTECNGRGYRLYGDTSTWRYVVGGANLY